MTLEQAFSIGDREVISLVGGGGKTTLMYALGRELLSRRKGIILTTTTKILEPKPSSFFLQFLSNDLGEVKKWITENICHHSCLLIARGRLPKGKLEGIFPEWVEEIFRMEGVSTIVNEADGSAGRPLKAPRGGEPVIPQNTTLLVPVIGIDGMGRPLAEETVFRSVIASRLLNLPLGSMVTENVIASLLKELMKSRPVGARVVPLINKIDLPDGFDKARKLAKALLLSDMPAVRKIVLGSMEHSSVVQAITKNFPSHP
jgi:probable selenium-dependent hydroxylase accessory protein YqeC